MSQWHIYYNLTQKEFISLDRSKYGIELVLPGWSSTSYSCLQTNGEHYEMKKSSAYKYFPSIKVVGLHKLMTDTSNHFVPHISRQCDWQNVFKWSICTKIFLYSFKYCNACKMYFNYLFKNWTIYLHIFYVTLVMLAVFFV